MSSAGHAARKDVEKLVTIWITVFGFAGVAINKRYCIRALRRIKSFFGGFLPTD
jgi:hypothetical protein